MTTQHAWRVLIAAALVSGLATPLTGPAGHGDRSGSSSRSNRSRRLLAAKVIITEDATKLTVELTTDNSGNYIRPLLKPGVYTVEVEMAGFKKAVQKNVNLNSGDRNQVNLTLEVGEVTQSVEITAAPPALQTENTELGGTLQSRQVVELPLGGSGSLPFWPDFHPRLFRQNPVLGMPPAAVFRLMASVPTARTTSF